VYVPDLFFGAVPPIFLLLRTRAHGAPAGKSIPPDALVLAETPAAEAATGVLTKVKNGLAIAGKLPCAPVPHLSAKWGADGRAQGC
jgi:hypothetical protein